MSIVTLPLPNQIANGQVADAVAVMGDLNYIAAQVNANAQPIGTTPTFLEWQALGQAPTFIGGTSFSVPGDLTATLTIGRRLQTTNTGGTIYSSIVSSAFGGGVTTVTVRNDAGVLDAGLSAVNIGILSALNTSWPFRSALSIDYSHNADVIPNGSPLVLCTNNGVTLSGTNASLSEFSTATGIFTAKRAGLYLVTASAIVLDTGVTFNGNTTLNIANSGGSVLSQAEFGTGVAGSNRVGASVSSVLIVAVSGTIAPSLFMDFGVGTPVLSTARFSLIGPL